MIVRLGPDATDRLRAVRLRSLRDAPHAFGSEVSEVEARPPSSWVQQLRDLPTWVAVLDGRDVGIVRGASGDHPAASELISMWVAPEARGRGLGDALVRAVVDWARRRGSRTLRLEVASDNAPAQRLYARHGFAPTGRSTAMPPPRAHVHELEYLRLLED